MQADKPSASVADAQGENYTPSSFTSSGNVQDNGNSAQSAGPDDGGSGDCAVSPTRPGNDGDTVPSVL